jgi:hypothetical protein
MAYSFLDLAYDVLKQASKPLTYQEIWHDAEKSSIANKVNTSGKTPWQSVGAQLYVEVRDNRDSRFIKVGKRPAKFFLKERQGQLSPDAIKKIETAEVQKR